MRRRWKAAPVLGLMTIALLVGTIGCGGGGSEGGTDLARGEKLYRQTCATCHGMQGEGIDRLGKSLIGNEFVALNSDSALLEFIIEGRSATHPDNTQGVDMPPRGGNARLTDDDIAAIIAYTRTLK